MGSEPALREIRFGECEGRHAKEVSQEYPNFGKGVDFTHRFPGGESGKDVLERMDGLLERIEQNWAGRPVVMFGHTMSLGLGKVLVGDVAHDEAGRLLVDRSKIPNAVPLPFTS